MTSINRAGVNVQTMAQYSLTVVQVHTVAVI